MKQQLTIDNGEMNFEILLSWLVRSCCRSNEGEVCGFFYADACNVNCRETNPFYPGYVYWRHFYWG